MRVAWLSGYGAMRPAPANPSDTLTLRFLGLTHALNGLQPESAVSYAERAVRLSRCGPDNASDVAALGIAYLAAGRHDDAMDRAQEAIVLGPRDFTIAVMNAIVLSVAAPVAEVRRAVAHMRELRPELPDEFVGGVLSSIAGPLIDAQRADLAGAGLEI